MTLDKLDEALSNLERRMGIERAGRGLPHRDDDISAIRARQEALARRERPDTSYRDAPPVRHAVAAPDQGGLQAELAVMREALNREMSSTIASQFASIREELKSLNRQGATVSRDDLADGFGRLTRELGVVASRVENGNTGALRAEVEELKAHVAALAREDTLRDMADRWSVIENEIGELPNRIGSREDLNAIADRIGELGSALHGLPDTRAIAAMEDQMRSLAGAVESLSAQNASLSPDHLNAIEERLDEITRAIVSVSVSNAPPEFDTTPFDRIEARLSSLARQVEERAAGSQAGDVERYLSEIAARLDALHESTATASPQNEALEAVTERLDELARRIGTGGGTVAGVPDGAIEQLNARFEDIAHRLDSHHRTANEKGQRMFESLDQRMEELARRIEDNERDGAAVPTFDHMERRIEEIAQMLTSGDGLSSGAPAQPDTRAMEGLEAQIAALSEKLSAVTSPMPDQASLADLAPRLTAISEQLATGREDMIAVAREAAEEVVAKFSSGASDEQKSMLAQLAGDLRALEELARNSDDRNTRTFEAIHDTLVKVAERIAGLEASLRAGDQPPPADKPPLFGPKPSDEPAPEQPKAHIEDAPPVDYAASEQSPSRGMRKNPVKREGVSPAEAAAMAARAVMEETGSANASGEVEIMVDPDSKPRKGLLSGLRGAMRRSGKKEAPTPKPGNEPVVFSASGKADIDSEIGDQPLEPGSGTPDLAEIMKRVRAERAGPTPKANVEPADDTGKSDFIAAARRAARAAADDASVLDKGKVKNESGTSAGRGLLASSRRPLMIGAAAILLALMAFPLVRGYLVDRGGAPAEVTQMQDAEPAAAVEPPAEMTAPASEIAADETAATVPAEPRVIGANTGGEAASAGDVDETMAVETANVATQDAVDRPIETETAEVADEGTIEQVALADIPEAIGPVALREAAAAGDPKALFTIGNRLMGDGPGAPGGDMAGAAKWYEMSAELGYAPAQYRIGNAYEKGLGVERDAATAKDWYQRAAEQGNVSAMHNLAVLYATGIDGTPDMASAGRWFLEAADRGVKDSQVNLGILSARGEGVPQDLAESYKWLALAAKAGDKDAEAKRDEVAGYMRPDQLETARAAVELWKVRDADFAANVVDVPDAWTTGGEMTASAPVSDDNMKKAIRNIQAILNNNGFDAGPADGIMGGKTRNAIIEFQKANDLLPTGEVDRALVDKLLELNRQS
ncbi:peptidoglycan-binding protein [Oricola indica]|uniref:peptidoglycan-binding protein n=1 Tax=Oricola indica TaxID=2872591 RepID=UPI003CCC0037